MADETDRQLRMNGSASENEVQLMTEEELEKGKMRPADIDQDMKEMERRKRVDEIMTSRMFREELERIVESQIQDGYSGYQALQNISEMMGIPASRTNTFRSAQSIIPINDIRGMETLSCSKGEKLLRCKLASIYRLVDMHGWTENIYNHCTARISQDTEHFLLNPFGLLYHEVTASSLVKVDMKGNVIDQGSTNMGVNVAGWVLHSAIHAARPDIRCVIHIHHPAVIAVASLKQGLLPLSQESLLIGDVSYHEYYGIFVNADEKEKLARNLGPVNKVMLLRNHGVVCCGETLEEAWYNTYYTVLACETQMRMMPLGIENLILVNDDVCQLAYETSRQGTGGVDSKQEGGATGQGPKERKCRVGELEFEALMRSLDNAGMRTGYIYRRPLIKQEPRSLLSDVALPPSASNYTHLFDEDELNKSPLRRILDGRRTQDKTRWLNSPNVYQKVEVLETGTPDPKKITKWVADTSPTHSTPVKLEDNLQFVPKHTNPKEFKSIQKAIKENRRIGSISAGPQSHLLEGVTWEEARRMQDANVSAASDHVVLVGAASKGIIQRDFQHHAVVYKTPYAKNPFDAVTDQELDDYRHLVERKNRGEPLEEIEVEQMHISPQRAMHDVLDDMGRSRFNASQLRSPTSDEEGVVLRLETRTAPRANKPQSVVLSDDGERVFAQKPALPPKPPAPLKSKIVPPVGPPQKVQATMIELSSRDELQNNRHVISQSKASRSAESATLPRSTARKDNIGTNSLSRGWQNMFKSSPQSNDESSLDISVEVHVPGVKQNQMALVPDGGNGDAAVVFYPEQTTVVPVHDKADMATYVNVNIASNRGESVPFALHDKQSRRPMTLPLPKVESPSAAMSMVDSEATKKRSFFQRSYSLPRKGVVNGDETDHRRSSKEGSPTKDTSLTDDSMSKDKKKKKKGLRTPSFLKKKDKKKKEKEAANH